MAHNILYRMYDADDRLLYVGMTINPHLRLKQHRVQQSWWGDVNSITLTHFDTRAALADAERLAIVNERPRWNVVRYQGPRRVDAPPRRRRYTLPASVPPA